MTKNRIFNVKKLIKSNKKRSSVLNTPKIMFSFTIWLSMKNEIFFFFFQSKDKNTNKLITLKDYIAHYSTQTEIDNEKRQYSEVNT
jgi:hypothetical protein